MNSKRVAEHLALLKIRRKTRQRDVILLGGVFIFFFLELLAFNLLGWLDGRSLPVVAGLVVVFGIAAVMAWVRLEIIKGTIELMEPFRMHRQQRLLKKGVRKFCWSFTF